MKIAVIGNSPTNAGAAMAADLALAGQDVRFARWTPQEVDFAAIRAAGGISVSGEARHFVGGKLGLARPELFDDPLRAAAGADLVVLDLVPAELEQRIATIAPALAPNQVVHVNTCSYWSSLRAAQLLREPLRAGLVLSESIAPTLTADLEGARMRTKWLRDKLPVAVFPAVRSEDAWSRLKAVYPMLRPSANVLETSLGNLNFLVHAAVALVNVSWFDRARAAGENTNFWMDGTTEMAGRLGEAQDTERRRLSEALGVPWTSTARHLANTYGGPGEGFRAAIRDCAFYQALPARSPDLWRRWLGVDVPQAHVPFAELARLAGVPIPVHDAFIETYSVLLEQDFRATGLTLEKLGLAGARQQDLVHYVRTGDRAWRA